jgi:hypothetical protein
MVSQSAIAGWRCVLHTKGIYMSTTMLDIVSLTLTWSD